MVRAILDGRKTQTRRAVKPQPVGNADVQFRLSAAVTAAPDGKQVRCPYGQPGDRLWVRETCRAEELTNGLDGVRYLADGAFREIDNTQAASEAWCAMNAYRGERSATIPSIHMPRWASRILLEITAVRVERLQDISDRGPTNDCCAEGVYHCGMECPTYEQWHGAEFRSAEKFMYRQLWEQINGPGSWDANPWVWVVEFKRIEA